MKVLVARGEGNGGGCLVDAAIAAGHMVRVFDKPVYEDVYLRNVDFVYEDLSEIKAPKPHIDSRDPVIYQAALVADPVCSLTPNPEQSAKLS